MRGLQVWHEHGRIRKAEAELSQEGCAGLIWEQEWGQEATASESSPIGWVWPPGLVLRFSVYF